jgi:hypothetical protein
MTTIASSFAVTAVVVGVIIALQGGRRALAAARTLRLDPERALGILRGFRIAIVGLCLAGGGVGWLWEINWLVALSIVICGEEVLESSIGIAALRHDPLILDSPGGTGRSSAGAS